MENTELKHWGVKGMKWGVRRYQNKDGTLTAAGKKRYASDPAESKADDVSTGEQTHAEKRATLPDIEVANTLPRLTKENLQARESYRMGQLSGKKSIPNDDWQDFAWDVRWNIEETWVSGKVSSSNPDDIARVQRTIDRYYERNSSVPEYSESVSRYRETYVKDSEAYAKAIIESIEDNDVVYGYNLNGPVDELKHWGVKGMKWGVRRYQNKDGTLTAAGKKRYDKEMEKLKQEERVLKNKKKTQAAMDKLAAKRKSNKELADSLESKNSSETKKGKGKTESTEPKKKGIKDMSDEELINAINRANLEKQYKNAIKVDQPEVSAGKKFLTDVIAPTATDVAKTLGKEYATKKGRELLGLKGDDESVEALKKAADKAKHKWEKVNYEDKMRERNEREQKKKEKTERENANTSSSSDKARSSTSDSNTGSKASSSSRTESKQTNTSKSDEGPFEGTVFGEGTSHSKYASEGRDWFDGPIYEGFWRQEALPAATNKTGEQFVSNILALTAPRKEDD